eukprot:gene23625-34310_t
MTARRVGETNQRADVPRASRLAAEALEMKRAFSADDNLQRLTLAGTMTLEAAFATVEAIELILCLWWGYW